MSESLFDPGVDRNGSEYARFVLAEYIGLTWFLLVAAAVGTGLDSLVVGFEFRPTTVFTTSPVLPALVVTGVSLALKPTVFDVTRLYGRVSGTRLFRSGALLAVLLVFAVFASRLSGGAVEAIPAVVDALRQDASPLVVGATLLLVGLMAVTLSAAVVGGVLGGAILGTVLAVFLDGLSLAAGMLAGATFFGILMPTFWSLDDRQVDQGSVAGGAIAVLATLVFASDPVLLSFGVGPLAAALGAGLGSRDAERSAKRATNGLVALRYPSGTATVLGYGGGVPDNMPSNEPTGGRIVRAAYAHSLDTMTHGQTWLTVLGTLFLLVISPLLLFVPLVVVFGHLFRVLASAAHGHGSAPGFSVLGRRATFKEGLVGVIGLSPYLLVGLFLAGPILASGGVSVRSIPVVSGSGPPLFVAVPGLVFLTAVLPAVVTSYAVDGRLRGAFDLRQIGALVARPEYLKYFLLQPILVLFSPVPLAVGGLVVVISFEIHGLVGLTALVTAGVGGLVVSWSVAFVSASLWGCYYYWRRPSLRFTPSETAPRPLLQRVLGLDEGPELVAGIEGEALNAGSNPRTRSEDDHREYRGIQ